MVGPLMVKQDLVEAKSNVSKRLEYINGEITRLDNQLALVEKKQSERQKEVRKQRITINSKPASLFATFSCFYFSACTSFSASSHILSYYFSAS